MEYSIFDKLINLHLNEINEKWLLVKSKKLPNKQCQYNTLTQQSV